MPPHPPLPIAYRTRNRNASFLILRSKIVLLITTLPVRIKGSTGLLTGFVSSVFEEEGCDVGRADGRVDNEDEDEPVPHGFERRVVEDRPAVITRNLRLVLG